MKIQDEIPEDILKKLNVKSISKGYECSPEDAQAVFFVPDDTEIEEEKVYIYHKPKAKHESIEGENGPVMKTSEFTLFRERELPKLKDSPYKNDDGFCVVVRLIQEMHRKKQPVKVSTIYEKLEEKKRYRELNAFKRGFKNNDAQYVKGYISGMMSKVFFAFGPDKILKKVKT